MEPVSETIANIALARKDPESDPEPQKRQNEEPSGVGKRKTKSGTKLEH